MTNQSNYTEAVERFLAQFPQWYPAETMAIALRESTLNTGNDDLDTCYQVIVTFQS